MNGKRVCNVVAPACDVGAGGVERDRMNAANRIRRGAWRLFHARVSVSNARCNQNSARESGDGIAGGVEQPRQVSRQDLRSRILPASRPSHRKVRDEETKTAHARKSNAGRSTRKYRVLGDGDRDAAAIGVIDRAPAGLLCGLDQGGVVR